MLKNLKNLLKNSLKEAKLFIFSFGMVKLSHLKDFFLNLSKTLPSQKGMQKNVGKRTMRIFALFCAFLRFTILYRGDNKIINSINYLNVEQFLINKK